MDLAGLVGFRGTCVDYFFVADSGDRVEDCACEKHADFTEREETER